MLYVTFYNWYAKELRITTLTETYLYYPASAEPRIKFHYIPCLLGGKGWNSTSGSGHYQHQTESAIGSKKGVSSQKAPGTGNEGTSITN